MTWRRAAGTAVFGMLAAGLVAGCAPVPSPVLRPSAAAHSPSAVPSPTPPVVDTEPPPPELPPPAVPVPAAPPATTASDAVTCAGHPGADRVIALLRAKGILAGTSSVTVQVGPLCAGGWQYTVLSEVDREPLQVVTQGSPDALRLVAAGTDVCTGAVVGQAPRGILTVARCTE